MMSYSKVAQLVVRRSVKADYFRSNRNFGANAPVV